MFLNTWSRWESAKSDPSAAPNVWMVSLPGNARLIGIGWGLTAVAVWSGSFVMTRLGVRTTLNAFDLTALRFAFGAILLSPVIWKQGCLPADLRPRHGADHRFRSRAVIGANPNFLHAIFSKALSVPIESESGVQNPKFDEPCRT
jgi:hypothetical protein